VCQKKNGERRRRIPVQQPELTRAQEPHAQFIAALIMKRCCIKASIITFKILIIYVVSNGFPYNSSRGLKTYLLCNFEIWNCVHSRCSSARNGKPVGVKPTKTLLTYADTLLFELLVVIEGVDYTDYWHRRVRGIRRLSAQVSQRAVTYQSDEYRQRVVSYTGEI